LKLIRDGLKKWIGCRGISRPATPAGRSSKKGISAPGNDEFIHEFIILAIIPYRESRIQHPSFPIPHRFF
jgi:hypothetical protein